MLLTMQQSQAERDAAALAQVQLHRFAVYGDAEGDDGMVGGADAQDAAAAAAMDGAGSSGLRTGALQRRPQPSSRAPSPTLVRLLVWDARVVCCA
jgi:hypothetical protein